MRYIYTYHIILYRIISYQWILWFLICPKKIQPTSPQPISKAAGHGPPRRFLRSPPRGLGQDAGPIRNDGDFSCDKKMRDSPQVLGEKKGASFQDEL